MDPSMVSRCIQQIFDLIPNDNWPDMDYYVKEVLDSMINPKYKKYKDYILPPGFEPEMIRIVNEEWEPREGDIVVASYPKTGTTWMREMVRNIIYRNDEIALEKTNLPFPWFCYLEYAPKEKFDVMDLYPMKRRIFATHLPVELIPFEKFQSKGVKIIYMMRNPKDQVISLHKFLLSFPFVTKIKPFTEIVPQDETQFIDRTLDSIHQTFVKEGEGYLESLKEWYKHKNDDNVKVVVFEDLKKDICGQLRNVAEFIQEDLTDEELHKVIQKTSVSSMKNTSNDTGVKFVRKGNVGGWKNHFTVAQSERMDERVTKILGDTDINFIYNLE